MTFMIAQQQQHSKKHLETFQVIHLINMPHILWAGAGFKKAGLAQFKVFI